MPFVWEMTVTCLELPYSSIRHFPAGSYYEQVKHWTGEAELELMKITHTAWHTFGYLSKSKWTAAETTFLDALRYTPPLPPSRRLEIIISLLWPLSNWAKRVIM